MKKLKLLIIDEKLRSTEINIEPWLFRQLNINAEHVKENKNKTALNKTVTEFIKNSGNS